MDTSPVDCASETSSNARTKDAKSRNPCRRLSLLAHTRASKSRDSSLRSKKRTASGPVKRPSLSWSAIWNQRRYMSCSASWLGVPAPAPAGGAGRCCCSAVVVVVPCGAPKPTPAPMGWKNCWSPARRPPALKAIAAAPQRQRWRRRVAEWRVPKATTAYTGRGCLAMLPPWSALCCTQAGGRLMQVASTCSTLGRGWHRTLGKLP